MNLADLVPHSTPDVPRLSALFERLAAQQGYANLDADSFLTFAAGPGERVVLFADDPRRAPETWDVAVVLPDLLRLSPRPLEVGLLMPAAADVHARAQGIRIWPALLFLRDGQYLGTIEGMRDWSDWVREIPAMLERAPGRPPTIGIPVNASPSNPGACH